MERSAPSTPGVWNVWTARDRFAWLETLRPPVLPRAFRVTTRAVVSERDIVRAVAEGRDLDTTTVADIGSRELVWLDVHNSIGDAAEEMMEDYVRHALIRDEGALVGVLSMRDVLSAYAA